VFLLLLCWMTSCTEDLPRSAWSVALETYHGSSTVIRSILGWPLWIIDVLDLLALPQKFQAVRKNRHDYGRIIQDFILEC
jgi:hypothetical protein